MLRRFFIIALLVCLPLRLWAGVGMMMNMSVASPTAALSAQEAPCHEAHDAQPKQHHAALSPAPATAEPAQTQANASATAQDACHQGQCASCVACHMLALQAPESPDFVQAAPRAWSVAQTGSLYAVHVAGLFKPPVF